MIGSVGVIIAIVVRFTDWTWSTLAAGVGIGLFILPRTWRLEAKVLCILVQAVFPTSTSRLSCEDLIAIPASSTSTTPNVWMSASDMEVATAHLRPRWCRPPPPCSTPRDVLAERYRIDRCHAQGGARGPRGAPELAWWFDRRCEP